MGTISMSGKLLVPSSDESTLPCNLHNLLFNLHSDLLRVAGYPLPMDEEAKAQ